MTNKPIHVHFERGHFDRCAYDLYVTPKQKVQIVCEMPRWNPEKRENYTAHINKTYKLGELAEYGSYNLSYYGVIINITPKQVWIQESDYRGNLNGEKHHLSLDTFAWRNATWNADKAFEENSDTMMYI